MREATLAWYGGLERDCAKALNLPAAAVDHGMVWDFLMMGGCNPGATCPAWLIEYFRGGARWRTSGGIGRSIPSWIGSRRS